VNDLGDIRTAVLRWSVRWSFRQYVTALSDGIETVTPPARLEPDDRVMFASDHPLASTDPNVMVHRFRGAISWYGHAGALDVELLDPHVHLAGKGRSTLSVAPTRRMTERVPIAAFTEWDMVEGLITVPEPRLLGAGVRLLGDVYDVGDHVDPIEIRLVAHPEGVL
jgi:hypothetical protein